MTMDAMRSLYISLLAVTLIGGIKTDFDHAVDRAKNNAAQGLSGAGNAMVLASWGPG